MLMVVSIGMFAFPTRLPKSRTPPRRADAKKPSLRGKSWFISLRTFRLLTLRPRSPFWPRRIGSPRRLNLFLWLVVCKLLCGAVSSLFLPIRSRDFPCDFSARESSRVERIIENVYAARLWCLCLSIYSWCLNLAYRRIHDRMLFCNWIFALCALLRAITMIIKILSARAEY